VISNAHAGGAAVKQAFNTGSDLGRDAVAGHIGNQNSAVTD